MRLWSSKGRDQRNFRYGYFWILYGWKLPQCFAFFVRGGKIASHHHQIIALIDSEEELTRYIAKFYQRAILPKELLVPDIVDANLLSDYFKISVRIPEKGVKKKLVDMASDNAKKQLEDKIELLNREDEMTSKANDELREVLGLEKLDRIELLIMRICLELIMFREWWYLWMAGRLK